MIEALDEMPNTSSVLLLLTSTIDCGNTPFVSRRSTEQRLEDYLLALKCWLNVPNLPDLVYCDNSGVDLTPIRNLAFAARPSASVRVLSFVGNEGAQELGKGFGEMQIFKHVVENLPDVLKYRHILKVSGRYFVTNAAELLRKLDGDSATVQCTLRRFLSYADSIVFSIAPRSARDHLVPLQAEINDREGRYFEHALAKCVSRILAEGGTWRPLPCAPRLLGVSGTSDWRYSFGALSGFRRSALHEIRRRVYAF